MEFIQHLPVTMMVPQLSNDYQSTSKYHFSIYAFDKYNDVFQTSVSLFSTADKLFYYESPT